MLAAPYIRAMTRLAAATLVLSLAAAPLAAQEDGAEEGGGFGLMERGIELFFRGMMDEMQPAFREFRQLAEEAGPALNDFLTQMGPALRDLLAEVEDWSVYEAPEILPNGDIIIRRKPEAPDAPEPEELPEAGEDGAVDI